MTLNRILLELLNVNGAVVDGAEFGDDASLTVHVYVRRGDRWRCPVFARQNRTLQLPFLPCRICNIILPKTMLRGWRQL